MSTVWTLTAPDGRTWKGTSADLQKVVSTMLHCSTIPVVGGKAEAEILSRALTRCQKLLVTQILAIGRKRSWRDSEKAMASAERHQTLTVVKKFNDGLQEYFEFGGW